VTGIETLGMDLRTAFRALVARPAFTGVAVLTLALGVGANTTVFSVVDAVLIRTLPFPDADRLVAVWETVPARGQREAFLSFPNYWDYRDGTGAFDELAAFFADPNSDVNLTGGVEPERVNVARVTANYFDVLGVRPALGRAFTVDEDREGNHRVAILSHALWARQFGSDPDLIGEAVHVNGFPYTVVGVMPAGFRAVGSLALGEEVELWRPLAASEQQRGARSWRSLRVVGRLRDGATAASAEREVAAVAARIADEHSAAQSGRGVRVVTLQEQTVGGVRRSLLVLWGSVALVLLIACANVANLLMIRAAGRARDVSIRASLGASRARIVRQLLVESMLLAGAGGLIGVLLASIGIDTVKWMAAAQTPLLDRATLDLRVLGFTLFVALATGVVFGLVPALNASRVELAGALKEGGGAVSSGWGATRAFVVGQLALTMVLLVGAGLLARSYSALRTVDPGFRPEGILTVQLELPMATTYPSQEDRTRFFTELRGSVSALPGVEGVANASTVPMGERGYSSTFWIEGRPEPAPEDRPAADVRLVSAGYFRTMGTSLIRGRELRETDGPEAPRVVVVNRTLAERFWPGADPIGAELKVDGARPGRIVGVVSDVRMAGLGVEPRATIYYRADQLAYNFMTLIVRTGGSPRELLPAIRELIHAMDSDLPVHNARTGPELLDRNVGSEAFTTRLLSGFALLALLLAVVGTYGVMATAVHRRRREIGVRLALGARPADVFALVLREGGWLVGVGVGIGLVTALIASRWAAALLFEVGPTDPTVYIGTSAVLLAAGLATVAGTARRAAHIDPVEPLRTD
jgi:putative ABC transport system permease protein